MVIDGPLYKFIKVSWLLLTDYCNFWLLTNRKMMTIPIKNIDFISIFPINCLSLLPVRNGVITCCMWLRLHRPYLCILVKAPLKVPPGLIANCYFYVSIKINVPVHVIHNRVSFRGRCTWPPLPLEAGCPPPSRIATIHINNIHKVLP